MNINSRPVVILTGGTGFLGTNLVKQFITEGWEVHVLVFKNSNILRLDRFLKHVDLHELNRKKLDLKRILKGVKPNIVIHTASSMGDTTTERDLQEKINLNINFPTQLAEAMTKTNCTNFINTGTFWENYNNDSYNPVNFYAATKHAFGSILKFYIETKALNVASLKLFDTYGPNDHRNKLIPALVKAAQTGSEIILTAGHQQIDLIHIDDVVNAYMMIANQMLKRQLFNGDVYTVASGLPMTVREIVNIFETAHNIELSKIWGAKPYKPREIFKPYDKLSPVDGWSPQITIADGIAALPITKT